MYRKILYLISITKIFFRFCITSDTISKLLLFTYFKIFPEDWKTLWHLDAKYKKIIRMLIVYKVSLFLTDNFNLMKY